LLERSGHCRSTDRTLLGAALGGREEPGSMTTRRGVPGNATRREVSPIVVAMLLLSPLVERAQTDPLPSWNDGAAKQAIVKFVATATRADASTFIPPAERIAVFDNDGTLWAEQPLYFQFLFVVDRVKALAPSHPEWKEKQPFKAVLEGDLKTALGGEEAVVELIAATHTGMTTEEFAKLVADWIATARHPRFGTTYTECVYQPMIELLTYLRANGFKTFIVSGGGVEFMRVWTERVYGIPPEQVVGSTGVTRFELRDGGPVLIRQPKVDFVNDGPGKPAGINRFIGRRPVFAFGNSDGDHQMLQWTAGGGGFRFMGLVHHTDSDREWAYDRASHIGKLDKALDEATARGWTVVDMKRDWNRIFSFEDARPRE
jgi:phosphoglycolate phosphatase-like HAD superfamily hydrolase